MVPPSYMRSIVDRNVFKRPIPVYHIKEMDFISLKFAYFVQHCAINAQTNVIMFSNTLSSRSRTWGYGLD
jgi:hypothetical protein